MRQEKCDRSQRNIVWRYQTRRSLIMYVFQEYRESTGYIFFSEGAAHHILLKSALYSAVGLYHVVYFGSFIYKKKISTLLHKYVWDVGGGGGEWGVLDSR